MVQWPEASGTGRRGFFGPSRFEGDVYDCETTQPVPKDLAGAFVRVGGEWFYPAKYPNDGGFSVDGYISMFRFKNGIVDYKGRWVKTPRWKANRAAGKNLFGNYRNPFFDDPAAKGLDRSVVNTAVVAHAGKLFALKEDTLPYEIDPKTLETVGPWNFGGKYKSQTFTAHPKFDPVTGDMICYGYEATGLLSDDVFVYTVNKAGQVTHEAKFKLPFVSMLHDIAITPKYILFPIGGYVTGMERLRANKVHWAWDPSTPSMIGIMRRDGDGSDIRWFKGELRATVHTFNAHEEGNKVVLEASIYNSNPFGFFENTDGTPYDATKTGCYMRRQTFDMGRKGDSYEDVKIFESPASDLGKIDHRYMGQKQSLVFTSFSDRTRPFDAARAGNLGGRVTNCYGRFDVGTKSIVPFFAGDVHSLQECAFVPKKGGKEGEGYILGVASNYAERIAELVVVDAATMTEITRVILPFRSGSALHGTWVGDDELDFG